LEKQRNIFQEDITSWLDDRSNQNIEASENALNVFAKSHAVLPKPEVKDKILNSISLLNKKRKELGIIDINNPPLLTEDSNLYDWQLATEGMQPPLDYENIHLQAIRSDEQVEMFVAWVKVMVDEEVHDDILESFMLLEGTCTCHITDPKGETRIVNMQAGDHITMQIGETHDVCITSEKPAKAVLQWLKIAA
jgi:mannose-6-phosphate isomerase-like protein (cupin superfamily)